MPSRDRVQPTRVAVPLVAREGQSAPSHGQPAQSVLVDVDDESDGASVASGCPCCIEIGELRLEASAEQSDGTAGLRAVMLGRCHRAWLARPHQVTVDPGLGGHPLNVESQSDFVGEQRASPCIELALAHRKLCLAAAACRSQTLALRSFADDLRELHGRFIHRGRRGLFRGERERRRGAEIRGGAPFARATFECVRRTEFELLEGRGFEPGVQFRARMRRKDEFGSAPIG